METFKILATCNSAGAAHATSGIARVRGHLDKVALAYSTTAATTCDVTISCYHATYGTESYLAVSNTNAAGVYYPRSVSRSVNNTAGTTYDVPMVVDGLLSMVVAQGGSGAVITGYVTVLEV